MDEGLFEDDAQDVLKKAVIGSGFSRARVAEMAGISVSDCRAVLDWGGIDGHLERVARVLGLDTGSLLRLRASNRDEPVVLPPRIRRLNLPFGPYSVNSWMILAADSRSAILFDVGVREDELVESLDREGVLVEDVFVTHGHRDHVGGLAGLVRKYPEVRVWVPEGSAINLAGEVCRVAQCDVLEWRDLKLSVRCLPGHSDDGTTYHVEGLEVPVWVSGDVLFARSIGGIPSGSLKDVIATILREFERMRSETLILPGHGPASTLEVERKRNPFLAV